MSIKKNYIGLRVFVKSMNTYITLSDDEKRYDFYKKIGLNYIFNDNSTKRKRQRGNTDTDGEGEPEQS